MDSVEIKAFVSNEISWLRLGWGDSVTAELLLDPGGLCQVTVQGLHCTEVSLSSSAP